MTGGAEHYAKGDELVARIEEEGEDVIPEQRTALAALAQAHYMAAAAAVLAADRTLGPQESWGGRRVEVILDQIGGTYR